MKARKGSRKYQCLDCKQFQMVHWVERERHTRLRCSSCGSLWLRPASNGAVEQLYAESDSYDAHKEDPRYRPEGGKP